MEYVGIRSMGFKLPCTPCLQARPAMHTRLTGLHCAIVGPHPPRVIDFVLVQVLMHGVLPTIPIQWSPDITHELIEGGSVVMRVHTCVALSVLPKRSTCRLMSHSHVTIMALKCTVTLC